MVTLRTIEVHTTNLSHATAKIIYICTEGRPWIKTSAGRERITVEEALLSNLPRAAKPYDGH